MSPDTFSLSSMNNGMTFSLRRLGACALALAALAVAPAGLPAWASGGSGGGGGSSGGSDAELAGEILIKLRSTNALQPVLSRYALTLVDRFGARPIYRVKVTGTARVKDVLALMALDPDILIAEANPQSRSPEARKNMPWTIGSQTGYVTQWAPQALRLSQAQALSTGAGVRVAVLDTGIDATHPLLAGRVLPGRDLVDDDYDPSEVGTTANPSYGHGTHVAGLIAMAAPGAQILPVRVLDPDGVGNAWVLAEAMLYAMDPDGDPGTDDGVHVINMSLGSLARTRIMDTVAQIVSCAPAIPDDPIGDRSDPGYADDERRCANGNGAIVIAASGNDGSGSIKEYPAAESAYGLVPVAASNASKRIAGFSNYGTWIDLAAPGEGITSSLPGGLYGTWSGTSMASPLMAGVAALVRARQPSLPPKDVAVRLKRTAVPLCNTNIVQVDALNAVTDTRPSTNSCK